MYVYVICVVCICVILVFEFVMLKIHEEARKFSYETGIKVAVAYGGTPITHQVLPFLFMFNLF